MNFLRRVNNVFKKDSQKDKGSLSQTLNKISLARNEFKNDFINDKSSPEFIALNNPIQFIYKYLNAQTLDKALRVNPQISVILDDNKLSKEYDIENVSSIIASHLVPTARLVHKIYYNINPNPDFENYLTLIQAALLHDIGKVFIPRNILNKAGKLTSREREIVELHNRLSYEILITTNLKAKVAHLAWQHHNYDNSFKRTQENQALMIADIYSALKEVRPYKKALNDIAAKTILYDMGASGKFDVGYIRYLCI